MTAIDNRAGGWSGIIAGVGLAIEGALWTLSGWTPATFSDPEKAITFLTDHGATLRSAVLTGFINLAFAVVFMLGLADRLRSKSPTLASCTLWFGMTGVILHLIVPFGHWYGTPAFVELAENNPALAESSWPAFTVMLDAVGGGANLFLGLAMLTAGWAAIAHRALPVALGWLAILTGAATVLTIFSPETPLSGIAGAVFMPSLTLSIIFRVWAGIALLNPERRSA